MAAETRNKNSCTASTHTPPKKRRENLKRSCPGHHKANDRDLDIIEDYLKEKDLDKDFSTVSAACLSVFWRQFCVEVLPRDGGDVVYQNFSFVELCSTNPHLVNSPLRNWSPGPRYHPPGVEFVEANRTLHSDVKHLGHA